MTRQISPNPLRQSPALPRRVLLRLVLLAVTSTVMVFAAWLEQPALSWLAAAVFPFAVILTEPKSAGRDGDVQPIIAATRARQIAWLFGWGAVAIGFGYGLSPLYWQHWWQYAAGMALLCAVSVVYVQLLSNPASALQSRTGLWAMGALSLVMAAAIFTGLVFLIASGKLFAGKPDWLANHVFMLGGAAIAIIAARGGWQQLRSQ
ncbi:MAG: hypothetical protein AAGC70_11730 [Pseudomonadota bacterium]